MSYLNGGLNPRTANSGTPKRTAVCCMWRLWNCRLSGFGRLGNVAAGQGVLPELLGSAVVQGVADVGDHHALLELQRPFQHKTAVAVQELGPPLVGHELGQHERDY